MYIQGLGSLCARQRSPPYDGTVAMTSPNRNVRHVFCLVSRFARPVRFPGHGRGCGGRCGRRGRKGQLQALLVSSFLVDSSVGRVDVGPLSLDYDRRRWRCLLQESGGISWQLYGPQVLHPPPRPAGQSGSTSAADAPRVERPARPSSIELSWAL